MTGPHHAEPCRVCEDAARRIEALTARVAELEARLAQLEAVPELRRREPVGFVAPARTLIAERRASPDHRPQSRPGRRFPPEVTA